MTQNYTSMVVDLIRQNDTIKNVMFVDDAYDAPPLGIENISVLKRYLKTPEFSKLCAEDKELVNLEKHANIALRQEDLENEKLILLMDKIFDNLINLPDQISENVGAFSIEKFEEIKKIEPLTKLFQQKNMTVNVLKSGQVFSWEKCNKYKPEIIFMDYVMVPNENIDESIRILNNLLEIYEDYNLLYPQLIIMSTSKIKSQAKQYLRELRKDVGRITEIERDGQGKQTKGVSRNKRVMAARFGVIEKKWVREIDKNLIVELNAGAVLSDIIGGSEFDRELQKALECWKAGATEAIGKLEEDLWNLDKIDFAYLIRYRLQGEGEAFADYLEWFLGETLRTLVDNAVNWQDNAFNVLDNSNLNQKIIGAHPYPSDIIARLYHNTRISGQENHRRSRFGLGDLFVSEDKSRIRMVLTPDCDLIAGANRNPAPRILTVGGSILDLKEKDSAANELIIIENTPKSIYWNELDVATHTNEQTAIDTIILDSINYEYFGTLRPLFAQNLQKTVLGKFARVGLEVPPAVYVTTPVSVYIKKNDQTMEKLKNLEGSNVTVILARGGQEKNHKVIFSRLFVYKLIEELENLPDNEIFRGGRSNKRKIVANKEEFCNMLLFEGLTDKKSPFGVKIVPISNGEHWLEFEIDYDKLSVETPYTY